MRCLEPRTSVRSSLSRRPGRLGTDLLKNVTDYLLWFAKNKENVKYRQLYLDKVQGVGATTGVRYDQVLLPDGSKRALTTEERRCYTNSNRKSDFSARQPGFVWCDDDLYLQLHVRWDCLSSRRPAKLEDKSRWDDETFLGRPTARHRNLASLCPVLGRLRSF